MFTTKILRIKRSINQIYQIYEIPYQQNRTDGFSWVCHVDRSIITHHFRHIGQCSTMIKMKVTEFDLKKGKLW